MHRRAQIRRKGAELAMGLPSTGANVYTSRHYPLGELELDCWIVSTDDTEEAERTDSSGGLQRDFGLQFTGIARLRNETELEDTLDTMAEELEAVIEKGAFEGLLQGLNLESTEFDYQVDEGDRPMGAVVLTYRATYFSD